MKYPRRYTKNSHAYPRHSEPKQLLRMDRALPNRSLICRSRTYLRSGPTLRNNSKIWLSRNSTCARGQSANSSPNTYSRPTRASWSTNIWSGKSRHSVLSCSTGFRDNSSISRQSGVTVLLCSSTPTNHSRRPYNNTPWRRENLVLI